MSKTLLRDFAARQATGFAALEANERRMALEMGWSEGFILEHWPWSAYGLAIARARASRHPCVPQDFAMDHTTNAAGADLEALRCCTCGREATDAEYAEYTQRMDAPQPPLMTNEPSPFEGAGPISAEMGPG